MGLKINGDDYLRSKIGAVCTILVAIVAMSYAAIKGNIMINYDDTDHQVTIEKGIVDRFQVFDYSNHKLNVALLINPKNWSQMDGSIDEYVSFSARTIKWGWNTEREFFERIVDEVPLRMCNESDKKNF